MLNSHEFLTSQICLLTLFVKDKILMKISEFTVSSRPRVKSCVPLVSGAAMKQEGQDKLSSGKKSCTCHLCGKEFPNKNKLARHFTTHTGQKDFICEYCHRAFARKDHLKSHKWNKHVDKAKHVQ